MRREVMPLADPRAVKLLRPHPAHISRTGWQTPPWVGKPGAALRIRTPAVSHCSQCARRRNAAARHLKFADELGQESGALGAGVGRTIILSPVSVAVARRYGSQPPREVRAK